MNYLLIIKLSHKSTNVTEKLIVIKLEQEEFQNAQNKLLLELKKNIKKTEFILKNIHPVVKLLVSSFPVPDYYFAMLKG